MAPEATFTNPFRRLLRIEVAHSADGEATVIIDPVPDELLQSRGIVHGGVYAALVDIAAGEAIRSLLAPGETVSTIDLNVSYLRPGHTDALSAEGRVLRRGRGVAFATADILARDGTLLATGRISMAIRAGQR
jgi:uncharacterized protein (TIGR00369 family)